MENVTQLDNTEETYATALDRVIWGLRHDLELLSIEDRYWLAEFIDHNKDRDIPRKSWLVFMIDYYNTRKQQVSKK
jgi:hypothetical protein